MYVHVCRVCIHMCYINLLSMYRTYCYSYSLYKYVIYYHYNYFIDTTTHTCVHTISLLIILHCVILIVSFFNNINHALPK